MTRLTLALVTFVLIGTSVGGARAQDLPAAPGVDRILLVFMDCQAPRCDFDHFRREIEWVNWVRDRQDAEVHVLVTSQRTGGPSPGGGLSIWGQRLCLRVRQRDTPSSSSSHTLSSSTSTSGCSSGS